MGAISEFFGNLFILVKAATFKPLESDAKMSVGLMVQNNAAAFPDDYALICEDEYVTWKELNERSNRVANFLKSNGIGNGDCVSLVMQNRIEFLVTLIGIVKIGAIAGLVNTNLSRIPLVHCINLIESKKCILGEEQMESLGEVIDELSLTAGKDYLFVKDTGSSPCPTWAQLLDSCDSSIDCSDPPESAQISCSETAYYVFTSGTTGLPKAAIVSKRCWSVIIRMILGRSTDTTGSPVG